jgi:hypothetical protein
VRSEVSQWKGVNELENCWGLVVVSCCCEKLVAEAGDSSEPRGSETFAVESHYQATAEKI